MAAEKNSGGFLQVPTPGGLAPLQKQTLNPVPTGSATGKNVYMYMNYPRISAKNTNY